MISKTLPRNKKPRLKTGPECLPVDGLVFHSAGSGFKGFGLGFRDTDFLNFLLYENCCKEL